MLVSLLRSSTDFLQTPRNTPAHDQFVTTYHSSLHHVDHARNAQQYIHHCSCVFLRLKHKIEAVHTQTHPHTQCVIQHYELLPAVTFTCCSLCSCHQGWCWSSCGLPWASLHSHWRRRSWEGGSAPPVSPYGRSGRQNWCPMEEEAGEEECQTGVSVYIRMTALLGDSYVGYSSV